MIPKIIRIAVSGLMLSVVAAGILSACSDSNSKIGSSMAPARTPTLAANNAPDPVTLKFMFFGERPADLDKVLAKFEEVSASTLNTKIEMEYNPSSIHSQKVKLKMATGEPVDLLFDGPWLTLYNNVSLGYYQELDKYFNNDEYPGLKKAFPPDIVEANKIKGHIYTIPLMTSYTDPDLVQIRRDIREQLGLPPIKTMEELKNYYDTVLEKLPGYIPASVGGRGFFKMFVPEEKGHPNIRLAAIQSDSFTGGIPFSVALSPDGKRVAGVATLGDPDAEFAKFPAPFNSHDAIYGHFGTRVEWRKYNNKNPLATVGLVDPAKSASGEGPLLGFVEARDALRRAVPAGDIEPFLYESQDVRDRKPGSLRTDFRANNGVVIPVSSRNADRTMKFIDWLFSSKDNHDLFELGIEGVHWIKDGDNGYKTIDRSPSYFFQGYELTWNPSFSRINTAQDAETLNYIYYARDKNSYYQIPLSGFIFDTKPVSREIAQIMPKFMQASDILMTGMDPDWRGLAKKTNIEMRSLGLENVRAEIYKQVQAYLDAGGK